MDAVILAAGRNDRLAGHVPAYMKPLLVVNGKTLVMHIISALGMCERIIVVASPDNVKQLVDVVSSERPDVRFVVQPQADGPAEALSLGLEVATSAYTLLACGDNVIPFDHWSKLLAEDRPKEYEVIVSTRYLPGREVRRFTYFFHDEVLEKEDPPVLDTTYQAWIGPVVFRTNDLRDIMRECKPESLSDILRKYEPDLRRFVVGNCSDIGIPEELP